MAKKNGGMAVVVTTEFKGVFFGYLDGEAGETVKLKRGRLCVYWTGDLRGFMGLATQGPGKGCKIGPAADIELRKVTSIVPVTEEAVARWEAAPWN